MSATLDFARLKEIAGGDDMFLSMLLSKICKNLPEAFTNMEAQVVAKDWPALKAASHKAKSTFAYLDLMEMRGKLQQIEHDAMQGHDLDQLPAKVEEAVREGRIILVQLQEALANLKK
jgi:HPt (histidine-containing phosphotransfer) domain-containing protein